ncbi:winged helix-turn-helix domain-containing protein [Streptomyces luteireticuli]|uniref:GntR family transcriptional regulator n=1 Tax=Streptomyces luteireticuli TaxID=173858 RepID=A0ABP3ILF4_9ACTN
MKFDPRRPKWQQIAEVIEKRIIDGTYPADRLISETQLQGEFDVAKGTARKALAALRETGMITTTPSMGSFVAERPQPQPPAADEDADEG